MLAILSIHCSVLHYERIATIGLPYVHYEGGVRTSVGGINYIPEKKKLELSVKDKKLIIIYCYY